MRTKSKKEQVTQEMSYSIVGEALADVPLDVVTLATMHVILGLTKKFYDWLVKMYTKLEALEEEKTIGRTTHQFRQLIVEARDNATEYCSFLTSELGGGIDTIEGKRAKTINIMK